jgi:hypothetical protein
MVQDNTYISRSFRETTIDEVLECSRKLQESLADSVRF